MSTAGGSTPRSDASETNPLVISGEAMEILELVPTVPRLENIFGHLKGCEYYDDESDEETYESNVNDPVRNRPYSFNKISVDNWRSYVDDE
jgi:hypothetical protein